MSTRDGILAHAPDSPTRTRGKPCDASQGDPRRVEGKTLCEWMRRSGAELDREA